MTNSKDNQNDNISNDVPGDFGVSSPLLVIQRSTGGRDMPEGLREMSVSVHNTIIDRFEGTAVTEPIWGEKANLRVIQTGAADTAVREECAQFFIKRRLARIITDMIPTHMVKLGEAMLLKPSLYGAISKAVPNRVAAGVVTEIVIPYLLKVGVLSTSGDYTSRFQYPVGPVTIDEITHDLASYEIVRVMESASVVSLAGKKYSKEVFAAEVADALEEVGRAFLDVNFLSTVVDDIVKGVRARVDIECVGLRGVVDPVWRDNEVVKSLASNWVFLEAALSLPPSTLITPSNEAWKLDSFAPGVLASLKSSARYAIVGKAEAIRNIGTRKVRNNRGVPISTVFWRAANPDAVGMSVYAYEDDSLAGAYSLRHTKERLGEVVSMVYARPDLLGTTEAALRLANTLSDVAQGGFQDLALLYQIDVGSYAFVENRMVAALCATRISIAFDDNGLVVRDASEKYFHSASGELRDHIKMWYTIATTERDLSWGLSGRYEGGSFTTASAAEAYLAMDEITPASSIDSKPQLFTSAAFNTRIVNFDTRSIKPVNTRYTFNVTVNGALVHGSFKPSDLGTMKANPYVSLVVPHYNGQVFTAVAAVFKQTLAICDQLERAAGDAERYPTYTGGAGLPVYLRRRMAREVLGYAQTLAPFFRAEVQRGMMQRAQHDMPMEQSIALRARLAQRAFGAYADVYALSLFIEMQGMGESAQVSNGDKPGVVSFWRDIISSSDMVQVYIESESDRPAVD